tara:strand:- start:1461 stop:1682 length:222 start_codon:yes stop_codon:yes gene_type:complete
MNPSDSIFWLVKKLSAEINVTALIEPYAAAIAAELKILNFNRNTTNPIRGINRDIIIAALKVRKTCLFKMPLS